MNLTRIVLLGLLLVATQAASIAHHHGDDALPADAPAKVCELCTAMQSGAPAPAAAAVTQHAQIPLRVAAVSERTPLPQQRACAHRSRAPPFFRSI
jgi:hypothetical protein